MRPPPSPSLALAVDADLLPPCSSIPSVFETLGIIPGVIILIVLAILTTWSGEILGRFKLRHPEVYSLSDCGRLMFGRVGDEVFGVAYFLRASLSLFLPAGGPCGARGGRAGSSSRARARLCDEVLPS